MAVKTVQFTLNGQTYDLTYDAGSGTYKATVTAPGTTSWNANSDHTYHGSVRAVDDAGNETVVGITDFSSLGLRVLEKTAPTIAVTYPASGAFVTEAAPKFQWKIMDDGSGVNPDSISIKIDGNAAITSGITKTAISGGYQCEYTPGAALAEGSHTVTFNGSDNDGNAATAAAVTFTVDTVPPSLNISSPADGLITNSKTLVVSGTTNDTTSGGVTVTVKVNNGAAQPATVTGGAFSLSVELADGANVITIVATDAAGKSTTIQRGVTLDTGAPQITAVSLTPNPVDAGQTYIITVTVVD